MAGGAPYPAGGSAWGGGTGSGAGAWGAPKGAPPPKPGEGGGKAGGGPSATKVLPMGLTPPPPPGGAKLCPCRSGVGAGGASAPGAGGAIPTMVPFIWRRMAGESMDAGPPAGGTGVAGLAGGAPPATGEFIISMVPLNFGAAAPFKLKPQLPQVVAESGFWAPQFGQYKPHLRQTWRP